MHISWRGLIIMRYSQFIPQLQQMGEQSAGYNYQYLDLDNLPIHVILP
jgi:hypothetical protein